MRIFVTLTCGHVNEYTGRVFSVGYERMCTRCNRVGFIEQIDAQYRWKCVTCHSGRSYGMSRLTMARGADQHQRRKPEHYVQLLAGDRILEVRRGKIFGETLDLPPF